MALLDENPFIQTEAAPKEANIFIDLLQTVVIALSICVVIYLFIATPNEVHGQSMDPTFHDGELLLTNKIVQLLGSTKLRGIVGDYNRGDVVIFHHTLSQEDFIKRIIAKGGDTIMVKDGDVYVNDTKLDQSFLPEGRRTESGNFLQEGQTVRVPEGSYVCFGDNRGNSTDSRSNLVGFVKRSQLKGRVFFRYWPLDRFGIIKGFKFTELLSSDG
jgi:signal peptidase I